jgi:hypothetical protein
MELQLGTKKQDWANMAETHTCSDSYAQAPPDRHQALAVELYSPPIPDWILDSGASAHVTRERNLLFEIRIVPTLAVTTVGGHALPIVGQGIAHINKNKEVHSILYIPGMRKNLLSVGKLADDGNYTLFGPRHCWVFDKDNPSNVIFTGTRSHGNGLYRLHASPQISESWRSSSSLPPVLPVHLASNPRPHEVQALASMLSSLKLPILVQSITKSNGDMSPTTTAPPTLLRGLHLGQTASNSISKSKLYSHNSSSRTNTL